MLGTLPRTYGTVSPAVGGKSVWDGIIGDRQIFSLRVA